MTAPVPATPAEAMRLWTLSRDQRLAGRRLIHQGDVPAGISRLAEARRADDALGRALAALAGQPDPLPPRRRKEPAP